MAIRIVPNVAPAALAATEGGKGASNPLFSLGFPAELFEAQAAQLGKPEAQDSSKISHELKGSSSQEESEDLQKLPNDAALSGQLTANFALLEQPSWRMTTVDSVSVEVGANNLEPKTAKGMPKLDVHVMDIATPAPTQTPGSLFSSTGTTAQTVDDFVEKEHQLATVTGHEIGVEALESEFSVEAQPKERILATRLADPDVKVGNSFPTGALPEQLEKVVVLSSQQAGMPSALSPRVELESKTLKAISSSSEVPQNGSNKTQLSNQGENNRTSVMADAALVDSRGTQQNDSAVKIGLHAENKSLPADVVDSSKSVSLNRQESAEGVVLEDDKVTAEGQMLSLVNTSQSGADLDEHGVLFSTSTPSKMMAIKSSQRELGAVEAEQTGVLRMVSLQDDSGSANTSPPTLAEAESASSADSVMKPHESLKFDLQKHDPQSNPSSVLSELSLGGSKIPELRSDVSTDSESGGASSQEMVRRKILNAMTGQMPNESHVFSGQEVGGFSIESSLKLVPHQVRLDTPEVAAKVLSLTRSGGGEVRIDVTPPDESTFKITLSVQEGGDVRLIVTGASDSTRTRLDQSADQLREQFSQLGLNLSLDFGNSSFGNSPWRSPDPSVTADALPGRPGLDVKVRVNDVTSSPSMSKHTGVVHLYA